MDTSIISTLQNVGFSENEAKVYIACLELGSASIWDIAKKSGIKRPTCYVLLDQLAFKGLANTSYDGRRTIYTAAEPHQLEQLIDRHFRQFQSSLETLSTLASKSPNKPRIQLYDGAAGVEEVYSLTLKLPKKSEILVYGTVEVLVRYGDFLEQYMENRVKKGIGARVILADTAENRSVSLSDHLRLRETRFIGRDKFPQKTEVNIFGDKLAYIAHSEKNPFATIIESATLAEEERSRFELIWEIASPVI